MHALRFTSQFMPGAIYRLGGESEIWEHFLRRHGASLCRVSHDASEGWPMSTQQIVAAAGFGTTGTRWLTCVMGSLGMRATRVFNPICNGMSNCTSFWDLFDFVSDTTVSTNLDSLLSVHPGNLFAAILPLRDPWEWQESRLRYHEGHIKSISDYERTFMFGIGVCAASDHMSHMVALDDAAAPASFVAVNAFSACIIQKHAGPDNLLPFNLFDDIPVDLASPLTIFLKRHFPDKNVTDAVVRSAMVTCNQT